MRRLLLTLLSSVLMLESSCSPLLSKEIHAAAVEPRVFTHNNRDMISINMFKVYEKYSKEPVSQREWNTVRSFKAVSRVSEGKEVFLFNMSHFQSSELILFASFNFVCVRPRHQHRPWRFRQPRHLRPYPPSSELLFQGASSNSGSAKLLGNITLEPFKKGSWQTIDVTAVVKHARDVKELAFMVRFETGFKGSCMQQRNSPNQENPSADNLPYILVYADDQAIDEPTSVVTSLQRFGPEASTSFSRIRRELHPHIKTNDIPEVQYKHLKSHKLWHNTYFPVKDEPAIKVGRKHAQTSGEVWSESQVLSFDERTMEKARRRQWSEPRLCSRRYLRVDFADIGWSEWVLAPKSFDAYYCAGTCGFPISKAARPSNHATIQSIVRAVGIIPGIPEPCCVPDKMTSLSVLFLDPSRNIVLKVYPGMSVETCSCL